MPPITNDWADYLKEEYKKPYYRKLYQKVMDEYHTKLIFPPADEGRIHIMEMDRHMDCHFL